MNKHIRSEVKKAREVLKLTCATYPKAVADFWISFLSVKKLIFLNDSILKCRPWIVKDPWLTGLSSGGVPGKDINTTFNNNYEKL